MSDLLPRAFFDRPVLQVATDLLGRVLSRESAEGEVAVRLTEVEAYSGAIDPASHAFRGRSARNAVMFGEGGHAYVYFTYGMHFCVNLVCGPVGEATAVLLRAGSVVAGLDLAAARRAGAAPRDLARGPARLTKALAIDRGLDGADACSAAGPLRIMAGTPADPATIRSGPRTGVSSAKDRPWRFWIDAEPSVSPYRAHVPKRRRSTENH